jgi:hypothetical protein
MIRNNNTNGNNRRIEKTWLFQIQHRTHRDFRMIWLGFFLFVHESFSQTQCMPTPNVCHKCLLNSNCVWCLTNAAEGVCIPASIGCGQLRLFKDCTCGMKEYQTSCDLCTSFSQCTWCQGSSTKIVCFASTFHRLLLHPSCTSRPLLGKWHVWNDDAIDLSYNVVVVDTTDNDYSVDDKYSTTDDTRHYN